MVLISFQTLEILKALKFDGFIKSQKTPSTLKGEGRGEGEKASITASYFPPPLNPLPLGEGKRDFLRAHKI